LEGQVKFVKLHNTKNSGASLIDTYPLPNILRIGMILKWNFEKYWGGGPLPPLLAITNKKGYENLSFQSFFVTFFKQITASTVLDIFCHVSSKLTVRGLSAIPLALYINRYLPASTFHF
jgi:hypothetical protein